ncbi:MAG: hypothetical protein IT462_06570 [Planctomycetes bacterium]|nr:hypothetical protein [Planctomycetota bacterium]
MSAIKTTLALLALSAIGAGVCCAEFPAHRVRLQRDQMQNPLPPSIYIDNRVVVRNFRLEANGAGSGIVIKGEVWTDFEVEAGHGLPEGQMTGLKVEVSLSEMRTVTEPGRQVPSQFATANVNAVEQGFGLAGFELPELSKPLPPGMYLLAVAVIFERQTVKIRETLKWCPDWYGDYGNPIEHEKAYQELLRLGRVKGDAMLHVGDICNDAGGVDFGRPGAEKVLCRDRSFDTVSWLVVYEKQRADVEADFKAKKITKQQRDRFIAGIDQNIAVLGGAASKEESAEHVRVGEVSAKLAKQISDWEDKLRESYWVLLDGHIWYQACNSITIPGNNVAAAVTANNNQADKDARTKAMNDPVIAADRAAKVAEYKARKTPAAITEAALKFFDRRDNSGDWDSEKFTTGGAKIVLDVKKWREHVLKVARRCIKDTQPILDVLNTTNRYCIQKWPEAYDSAKAARDAVLTLGFAHEFTVRTDKVMKDAADTVKDDLESLAAANADVAEYIRGAKGVGYSTVQGRINAGVQGAKNGVKLFQFMAKYGKK